MLESMTEAKTSKRILIADDEQYIRELYQEVLADAGFEVDTAGDGKEALEKITAGGYSLIALDVIMPQLDGLGVLQELQHAKPKQANGPILLLTSLVNDPAVKNAEALGVKQVLYKTEINPQQLVDIVVTMIGQSAPAAAPDKTTPKVQTSTEAIPTTPKESQSSKSDAAKQEPAAKQD